MGGPSCNFNKTKRGKNFQCRQPEVVFLVLLCRSLDLNPGLGFPPSIQNHYHLCIATQITNCYWSEGTLLFFFGFTRDTRNREPWIEPRVNLRGGPAENIVQNYLKIRPHIYLFSSEKDDNFILFIVLKKI